MPMPVKSKYGSHKIRLSNGEVYDSKAEYQFSHVLRLLRVEFERQIAIVIQKGFSDEYGACRAIEYVADFVVGKYMIDVKGFATADFMLKAKILRAMKSEGRSEYILLIAKKAGNSFVLWEWCVPAKNSKRKCFDVMKFKE